MTSGTLDHRAEFSLRESIEDDMGGTRNEWVLQFVEWVGVRYLRGTEAVMQARLASRNPMVITVRNSARARQITSEWRVTLRSRSGVALVAEAKEDPRPASNDAFLEFLAEA